MIWLIRRPATVAELWMIAQLLVEGFSVPLPDERIPDATPA